jgi:hypothetical protein
MNRLIRTLLAGTGLLLVMFHAWLFVGQAWDGQLTDVPLVVRWLVAAGLLVVLRSFRRRGVSIVRGRRAIAVWVLAALLHGPALADRMGVDAPVIPDVVAALAPVSASVVLASLFVLLALVLGVRLRPVRPRRGYSVIDSVVAGPFALDAYPAFAARPPPRA